jgi:Mn2+/Fe2+ NRAMP family transporter
MGMPMPLGIASLSRVRPELIPWMWGINGATSVVASVLAVAVSLNIGLRNTLLIGVAIYAIAWLLMLAMRRLPANAAQRETAPVGARLAEGG